MAVPLLFCDEGLHRDFSFSKFNLLVEDALRRCRLEWGVP